MHPTETLARLEKAFSSIHVLVAYLDPGFNFIWVNRAYAAADERPPDYFVGKNHFDLYPSEENEAIFRRVVESRESYVIHQRPFRYPQHPERGTTFWDWALEPVTNDDGSLDGLVFVLVDVTDKVRANRHLADTAVYVRGLVETNPDPFIAIDTQGHVTDVNAAAEALFGYARSHSIGSHFTEYCKDVDQAVRGHQRVLNEGAIREYPIDVIHRDGHVIPVMVNASVHRDAAGEIVGMIATARDVTERLRHEEERRKLYEQLLGHVTELRRLAALMARAERLAGIGYWYNNLIDTSVVWSDQTYRLFGLAPQSGTNAADFPRFVRKEDLHILEQAQQSAMSGEGLFDAEFRIARADGEERLMHAQGELERDPTGRPIRLFGIMRDITETRRKEWMLRERFRLMAEVINDVLLISTPNLAEVLYINPAYERIWDRSRDSLYAEYGSFFDTVHPADRERVYASMVAHTGGEWEVEYRIVRPDDSVRWIQYRGFPLQDERGATDLLVGVATDITALKTTEETLNQTVASLEQANRELEQLSFQDPLTGVKNRRYLEEYIQREWPRERRHGHDVSLIMLDVDQFKSFNDVYGHPRGDECLRQIARELTARVRRPTDVVARVGGEEFAVLLPETGLSSAERLAEHLRESIAGLGIPHERSSVAPVVTVSLGVAALNPRTGEFQSLIEKADRALYRAKDTGRNRVEAWH